MCAYIHKSIRTCSYSLCKIQHDVSRTIITNCTRLKYTYVRYRKNYFQWSLSKAWELKTQEIIFDKYSALNWNTSAEINIVQSIALTVVSYLNFSSCIVLSFYREKIKLFTSDYVTLIDQKNYVVPNWRWPNSV